MGMGRIQYAVAYYLKHKGVELRNNPPSIVDLARIIRQFEPSLIVPPATANSRKKVSRRTLMAFYEAHKSEIVAEQGERKARRNGHKNWRKSSIEFYASKEWRQLRYRVLAKRGAVCECCGRTPKEHGVVIHVDHIKPRWHFPELELIESNLQILCEDCNLGKGARDQTDWRFIPGQSMPDGTRA